MELDDLFSEFADSGNDSLARMIIEERPERSASLRDPEIWPMINYSKPEDTTIEVDIVNTAIDGWRPNIIERYSSSISDTVKFPVNTAMLHGMGCFSAAASRNFKYSIYGDKEEPVNLFVVTAQPPSTGKSGVNSYWMDPIRIAFGALNKARNAERLKLESDIDSLKEQVKSTPGDHKNEVIAELAIKQERAEMLTPLKVTLDDATPEALEREMGKQDGWANIVSDEADAVNIMLGMAYGDSKTRKSNHGVFLKMYSGEWHSSSRIGRDGFEGFIRGSFVVLAQSEAVESILLAGESGRGVSERILLMKEPHKLGTRNMEDYTPINGDLRQEYIETISAVVSTPDTVLRFDGKAVKELAKFRNEIESEMGDQGKFSDNMTRGAMGKADKQVCKIASILWIASEWSPRGSRRTSIGLKTMRRAIEIFKELSRTYLKETEARGYSGDGPKIAAILDFLRKRLQKDLKEIKNPNTYPSLTVEYLANALRKRKEFDNIKTGDYLRTVAINRLEEEGYIIRKRNSIYTSPRILE